MTASARSAGTSSGATARASLNKHSDSTGQPSLEMLTAALVKRSGRAPRSHSLALTLDRTSYALRARFSLTPYHGPFRVPQSVLRSVSEGASRMLPHTTPFSKVPRCQSATSIPLIRPPPLPLEALPPPWAGILASSSSDAILPSGHAPCALRYLLALEI